MIVFTRIYKDLQLTIEIVGALLASTITVFITSFLIKGQAIAEELKERKEARKAIFNIIDLLTKEMNLGGEISEGEQEKLDKILRKFDKLKNKI